MSDVPRSGPPASPPIAAHAAATPRRGWHRRINLRPRQLELLLSLVELRSVAAAAKVLHVTQPAVSKSLAAIEDELGVTLFRRTPRGLEPTELGICLARHAQVIVDEYARADDEFDNLARGVTGKVTIGATPGPTFALVPSSVALLMQRSPSTRVVVQGGNNEGLIAQLRAGEADLILLMIGFTHGLGDLSSQVLYEEALIPVTGSDHRLASKERPEWKDLDGLPWVLPPFSRTLRLLLEDELRERGVRIAPNYVESLSLDVYIGVLRETDAIAFLPRRTAEHFERLGQIRILSLGEPIARLPVVAMWRRDRTLDGTARLLLDCIEEVAGRLGAG